MSLPPLNKISQLLDQSVQEQIFSGFQLYCERGSEVIHLTGGFTSYWPDKKLITEHTFFDIGSVTKAVFTTTTIASLVQKKILSLDQTVGQLRPEFLGTGYSSLTLEDLLSHSAGLLAHTELPTEVTWENLISWFKKNEKKCVLDKPKVKSVYSDFGFLLLGLCLESIESLPLIFDTHVVKSFHLSNVLFGPIKNEVASTEFSLLRNRLLAGEVFDQNTFQLAAGKSPQICPHAGLFSSAISLAPWAREWLKGTDGTSKVLTQSTASLFTQKTKKVKNSDWALGWDTRSATGSSAGNLFSLKSFGHLGYPGASVWIDPEAKGFAIFLTNRVHPSRYDFRIRNIRPQLHDLIFEHWRAS